MFTNVSDILSLPYIMPSQAQKHVTHNEALRMLDLLVQMVVSSRQVTEPPAGLPESSRYIVPAGATGAFSGQAGKIALWETGVWIFTTPLHGWRAEVLDENRQVVFDGTDWVGPETTVQRFAAVGIAADADATNRLAVSAAASLLTHDGAGHQVKINKAAAIDTASLLFQTGFSGRAEMGTTGSDAFEIKTSADGVAFQTALRAAPATGRVELPAGLTSAAGTAALPGQAFVGNAATGFFSPGTHQIGFSAGGVQRALLSPAELTLDVALTGTAVTQTATDTTPGRLLKVGDFGLGSAGPNLAPANSLNALRVAGFYRYQADTTGKPDPAAGTVLHVPRLGGEGADRHFQIAFNTSSAQPLTYRRMLADGTWGPWANTWTSQNLLGAVSQAGGVPTGAVMERGTSANGDHVRFADGTQICTHVLPASSGAATSWTYPAAFAAAPVVTGTAQANVLSCVMLDAAPTPTACTFSTRDKADARRGDTVRICATGRWF